MMRLPLPIRFVMATGAVPAAAGSGPAQAQWLGADYAAYGAPYSNFVASSFLNQSFMNRAVAGGRATTKPTRHSQAAGSADATIVSYFQPAATAHALAQRYDASQRPQIERAFVDAFQGYQKIEAKFGLRQGDVAGSLAAFLAGNLMAYRDMDFPDERFPALVEQIRTALTSSPAFIGASATQKRQIYEETATIGMFMAVSREALKRKRNPEAEANFRQTAKANLDRLLGFNASRLDLTKDGIHVN
jgi:hypothetical protein